MNKQEQVNYLANIYHLVIADGDVERLEEKVFEDISRDISAGYVERRRAMELAQKDRYQLQSLSRWSDRIRNLEDMLFAAFCDGILESAEKKLIKDCANCSGINQQQFDTIKKEAKRRYAQHKTGTT